MVFFLTCPSLDCELQEAGKFDTNGSLPLEKGLALVDTPGKREREKKRERKGGVGGTDKERERKRKKGRLHSATRVVPGRGRVLER